MAHAPDQARPAQESQNRGPAASGGDRSGDRRPPRAAAVVRAVLGTELLRLVRDRKALLLALVLPMALYPLLFWGSRELGRIGERQLAEENVRALIDLSGLEEGLANQVRAALEGPEARIQLEPTDFGVARGPKERAARATQLLDGQIAEQPAQVLVLGSGRGLGPRLLIYHRGTNEQSMEGARRVETQLEALGKRRLEASLSTALGADPAPNFQPLELDLAPARDRAGASLGRLLPLILTLVLISGGAFAALDAFAAERELGTLETLLVQPVAAGQVALGKFLAVLATALVTWAGNAASLLLCAALGLFDPSDLSGRGSSSSGLSGFDLALLGRVALGALLFLPTAALLAAALCLTSARARSFREGQQLLMPLTLLAVALTAPASLPTVELTWVLALLPLLGPALAMRDALVGQLGLAMGLLVVAASLLPLFWALGSIGRTLDAERLLKEDRPKGDLALGERQARFSRSVGLVLAISLWLLGGSWISQDGLLGRGMALLLAALVGLWLARRQGAESGLGLAAALGLGRFRAPSGTTTAARKNAALIAASTQPSQMTPRLVPRDLQGVPRGTASLPLSSLWALLGAALLAVLSVPLASWSEGLPTGSLYPAAERLEAALLSLNPGARLLWQALLPALALELAFRGAVLGGLLRAAKQQARPLAAVMTQALLFTLAEGALIGWLDALALGIAAGWARLSSVGLWAALLLHVGYRALAPLAPDLLVGMLPDSLGASGQAFALGLALLAGLAGWAWAGRRYLAGTP